MSNTSLYEVVLTKKNTCAILFIGKADPPGVRSIEFAEEAYHLNVKTSAPTEWKIPGVAPAKKLL